MAKRSNQWSSGEKTETKSDEINRIVHILNECTDWMFCEALRMELERGFPRSTVKRLLVGIKSTCNN